MHSLSHKQCGKRICSPRDSSPGNGGARRSAPVNPPLPSERKHIDAAGDKDDKKRIKEHKAKKRNKKENKHTTSDLKGALKRRCVCSADDVSPFATSA